MKLKKFLLCAVLALSFALASDGYARVYQWTRGKKTQTATRNFDDLDNLVYKDTGAVDKDYYTITAAKIAPGASDIVELIYNSRFRGTLTNDNPMRINLDTYIGRMIIRNNNGITRSISSSSKPIIFNTATVDGGTDIFIKERNLDTFTVNANIRIASNALATATISNTSDASLVFSNAYITVEPAKIGSITRSTWLVFNLSSNYKYDQWIDYSRGDIIIDSQLNSAGSIDFKAVNQTSPHTLCGNIWFRGKTSNSVGWYHFKNGVVAYLDKDKGAQSLSSTGQSGGRMIYLGGRSRIVLMNDDQIADDMTIQFKTPILDSNSPSDLTGILDLNGFSERLGQIEFWNDNGSPKQGLQSVIDFGEGGEQSFIFRTMRIPSDTSFKNRVHMYRTKVEFRSYRAGEDHVYCATKLSTITYKNDSPTDTSTKTCVSLLHFPEFGLNGVDYTVSETQVTVNGETLYEYAPTPVLQ